MSTSLVNSYVFSLKLEQVQTGDDGEADMCVIKCINWVDRNYGFFSCVGLRSISMSFQLSHSNLQLNYDLEQYKLHAKKIDAWFRAMGRIESVRIAIHRYFDCDTDFLE